MKKKEINFLFFIIATLTLILSSYSSSLFAQEEVEVLWRRVNVRSGPGTTYSTVGSVYRGERYPVLGESGNWTNIQLNDGKKGWVRSDTVKPVGIGQLPEPETEPEHPPEPEPDPDVEPEKGTPPEISPEPEVIEEEVPTTSSEPEPALKEAESPLLAGLEEYSRQIALLKERMDSLEEKMEKMIEVGPPIIKESVKERPLVERIHGGIEVGWFSPADILRNEFGPWFSFAIFGTYDLYRFFYPRLSLGYLQRTVYNTDNEPTELSLMPIDVSLVIPFSGGKFRPYIGGGLGITVVSLSPDPFKTKTKRDTRKTAYGYNLLVGIDIPLYKRLSVLISAKYSFAGFVTKSETEYYTEYSNLDAGGTSINLGLRY